VRPRPRGTLVKPRRPVTWDPVTPRCTMGNWSSLWSRPPKKTPSFKTNDAGEKKVQRNSTLKPKVLPQGCPPRRCFLYIFFLIKWMHLIVFLNIPYSTLNATASPEAAYGGGGGERERGAGGYITPGCYGDRRRIEMSCSPECRLAGDPRYWVLLSLWIMYADTSAFCASALCLCLFVQEENGLSLKCESLRTTWDVNDLL